MKRHRELWATEDRTRLKDLLAAGRTMKDAAKHLGRTEEAARTQAVKGGLLAPRPRRKSVVLD
jgi:hypothetical protein